MGFSVLFILLEVFSKFRKIFGHTALDIKSKQRQS
jgi:hypothetical protein